MVQTVIDKNNLAEFQRWLLDLKPRSDVSAYDLSHNLRFDLPLSVILDGAPTLSPIAQEVVAAVIAGDRGYTLTDDVKTLLNLAETQPILLGRAYRISGNSRSGRVYSALLHELKNRPFEKNIPAIYAMMHFLPVYGPDVGIGDIAKTSTKNAKLLNEMFKKSGGYSNNDQFRASAHELIDSLDMGKLLNFEGASPEFRARINAANFNGWRNDKYEKIAKINPDLVDEQILADFINTPMPKRKEISGAKTQKEKNANILPISYTKPRDALLRMVEREEIHDRNNYGHAKTLTQRYKELKARMLKNKTWPADNPDIYTFTLANDVYRMVIQRDIIDGRAADLSDEELKLALNGDVDKDGFYIRHVPDDVLKKLNLRLNRRQEAIVSARNSNNLELTVRLNNVSTADKRAAIKKAERAVAADSKTLDALDAELAAYDKDYEVVKNAGANAQNANTVYTDMDHIQAAYKRIRDNFKDGAPNASEAHLVPSEMERAIYGYITGASERQIDIPTQKSLPIFGRGTEKERRERLVREIRDFNKVLADVRGRMTDELVSLWAQYRGAILNPDSLSNAGGVRNSASNAANSMHSDFQLMHRDRSKIKSEQKQYASKKESLDNANAYFEAQQKKLREMSRHHMGRDQSGELIPVTDDMSVEEKRTVRAKNRKTLNDKLTARSGKKPAKNLAEMLANADMERR